MTPNTLMVTPKTKDTPDVPGLVIVVNNRTDSVIKRPKTNRARTGVKSIVLFLRKSVDSLDS